MKSYYLLIPSSDEPTILTPFFKLSIGTSERDVRNRKKIEELVNENGWFFAVWSIEVRSFVEKLAQSMNAQYVQLNWQYWDINKLVTHLRKYHSLPMTNEISRNQLMLINRYAYQSSINVLQEAGSLGRNKPKFRESDLN